MQKTFLYLLILVILGAAAWYFVFRSNDNIFDTRQANFAVKDTASIGKIYLARSNGQTITLERKSDGWTVNGDHKALSSTLHELMTTLAQQTAQYPVPENMHNNVVKTMSGNSIKVEVYDRQGRQIRVFYVGSEAKDYTGTFMLMDGADRPYVVQIPNFQGYLTSRYSTDIADWKDRTVFDQSPEQLGSISVSYPDEPLNSFTVKEAGGKPVVDTDPQIKGNKPLNLKRTQSYLKFYDKVYCEGFLNGVQGVADAISQTRKRCTIDAVAKDGKRQHVDVYWMPITKRSKNRLESSDDTPDEYDPDRFYAVMNNFKDTVLVQRETFDKLFRKAWEFYEADKPTPVLGVSKGFK